MNTLKWIFIGMIVLGNLVSLASIDKPRKPQTAEGWLLNAIAGGILIWLLWPTD